MWAYQVLKQEQKFVGQESLKSMSMGLGVNFLYIEEVECHCAQLFD
jgi:hypothetical protein